MFPAEQFFESSGTEDWAIFPSDAPAWEAIGRIAEYLSAKLDSVDNLLIRGEVDERAVIGDRVFIAEGATVEANATIKGPAWIGEGTVIRAGAYLRENVLVGKNCTLGNSSEFKNCFLFDNGEVPHFNYVGDSILGYKAHLGAGVICSNVRLDRANVQVRTAEHGLLDTGLRKFGALVGDGTEIGCNSVLSPGSILGRECILYPLTHWQGVLGNRQIVKTKAPQQVVARKG